MLESQAKKNTNTPENSCQLHEQTINEKKIRTHELTRFANCLRPRGRRREIL